MDKIEKALDKLTKKEREKVKAMLEQVKQGNFRLLDVKKLKGRDDVFRVRKGDIRIIFRKDKKGNFFVLAIERKSDRTYKQRI
jgi:mRNA-degrading endonuclease RelE of RelBE toxin-antitoxin system